MPTFYHATPARNQSSIESSGFHGGSGGYDGPGIYFCKRPEAAINRARIPRGEDAAVFTCEIPLGAVGNVNNQDNFKVETSNARRIQQRGSRVYKADEVGRIKRDKSYVSDKSSAAPRVGDAEEDLVRRRRDHEKRSRNEYLAGLAQRRSLDHQKRPRDRDEYYPRPPGNLNLWPMAVAGILGFMLGGMLGGPIGAMLGVVLGGMVGSAGG